MNKMKRTYISPIISFETIEDNAGILVDVSHTELKSFKSGKKAGTFSEDPIVLYDNVLTPTGDAKPTTDWDLDE